MTNLTDDIQNQLGFTTTPLAPKRVAPNEPPTIWPVRDGGKPALRKPVRRPETDQPAPVPPGYMSDLIQRIQQDTELTARDRRDRISAIQRLCRFAGAATETVQASPPEVNRLLEKLSPAFCDITPKAYANLISLIRGALYRYQPDPRSTVALPPTWQTLVDAAGKTRRLTVLRRFIRFCVSKGWTPQDVDNAKIALYEAMLKTDVILSDTCHIRNVVTAWNRGSKVVPGWPAQRLSLAKPTRRFTRDWDEFPKSLRDDLDAYIAFRTKVHLTSLHLTDAVPLPPLRPSSVRATRYQVRSLASALVCSGVPIEKISKLSVLTSPDMAERAMDFFVERHGGSPKSSQTHQLSTTLLTIGALWCKLKKPQIKLLKNIRENCTYIQIGMTHKNRDRLIVLDDPRIRRRLLELPATLEKLAGSIKSKRLAASRMQLAVAVEFLLNCPTRVTNLAALDLDRHFRKGTAGPKGETQLVIPAQEVKNDVDLDLVVPPTLVNLINRYREKYRPALTGGKASTFLFPTPSGKSIASNTLSAAIAGTTKRHLGVQVNPHLLRHFAGALHLERHPGDYATVMKLLGHKSIKTTINYYLGKEATAASRHYQETLLKARTKRPEKGDVR